MKLILPRLPGLNEYISAERSNKHAAAGMKRQCEREIRLCIRAQWKGKVRFQRPVAMRYLWVEKNKRRDKDNIAFAKKFIQDALVKEKVIQNDGWKEIDSWTDAFAVDAQRPRVEVELEEV
nr:MAG TPA: Endodeoxyribonuclease RusA [Caudoviricetes sp.]